MFRPVLRPSSGTSIKNFTKKYNKKLKGPLVDSRYFLMLKLKRKIIRLKVLKKCVHNDFVLFRSSCIVERFRIKILV